MSDVLAILAHDESSHYLMAPQDIEHHLEQEHGMDFDRHPVPMALDEAGAYVAERGIDTMDLGEREILMLVLHEKLHALHDATGKDQMRLEIE